MRWMGVVVVAGLVSVAGFARATGFLEGTRGGGAVTPALGAAREPERRIEIAAAPRVRPHAGEKVATAPRRKAPGTIPATVALLMLVGAGPKGR